MTITRRHPLLAVCSLLLTATVCAQTADINSIKSGLSGLRSLPEDKRAERTGELAHQIASLPPGKDKLGLAVALSHLSTEGDPGRDNLQAVTDTLAQAVKETPVSPGKNDAPSGVYVELAELVRYEGMTAPAGLAAEPQYQKAMQTLIDQDKQIEAADFTLKDMHGKKWTLSALRGKIVVVNFWATWCPPCRMELPALDALASRYGADGLVVLALTDEDASKVTSLFRSDPHFTVLFDDGHKVGNAFHVAGIPRTFVFNREGRLAAEAVDARTPRQFGAMLLRAGLKP
jgi:thiol-disulfide isomerase/thioredoxin